MSDLETMMEKAHYIHAEWDDDARVWVASSTDVAGLATEAPTIEALIDKLKIMVPELLEANGSSAQRPIAFELMTRRFELAA